jgi:hypothetical protein
MIPKRSIVGAVVVACLASGLAASSCGGEASRAMPMAPGGSKDPSRWPADDRSMCDWRNKPDVEVSESIGPGSLKPNVRRVYKFVGEGDSRRKSLVCREIDTNLDGVKDVVRTFNAKGEALREEADTDYDGKIDVWLKFVDGRLAEEQRDTNHDGKPDIWKFYVGGQLQRVRRDRNSDGKPDVWEFYSKGRLERIGADENADGHVDRWDRDEQLKLEAEAAERKAQEKPESADAGADSGTSGTNGTNGTSTATTDAGAPRAKGSAKR